jgi:hypothetical protein
METMTVEMELMNRQSIVNLRAGLVSVICLLAITAIVFREFIFAMGTMIVWTTVMRTIDISAVSSFTFNLSCFTFIILSKANVIFL